MTINTSCKEVGQDAGSTAMMRGSALPVSCVLHERRDEALRDFGTAATKNIVQHFRAWRSWIRADDRLVKELVEQAQHVAVSTRLVYFLLLLQLPK